MKSFTCAFTGPRPSNLPIICGKNVNAPACLFAEIEGAIRQAVHEGFRIFVSGGAMGSDLWCAQKVMELKDEIPDLQLHFYLPCETQANEWTDDWRECYFDLLAASNNTVYIQHAYTKGCMSRRNRALVDASSRLIAIYDGVKIAGGTAYTVRYAEKSGVSVYSLWPFS